jgi:PspAA-like protein
VIVRIATEGQYDFPDDDVDRLNELDNEVVEAVEAGDEERFQTAFASLLELVRSDGRPVADDVLEESDVIIPPPDLTFAEAGHQFTGDGLIPD